MKKLEVLLNAYEGHQIEYKLCEKNYQRISGKRFPRFQTQKEE